MGIEEPHRLRNQLGRFMRFCEVQDERNGAKHSTLSRQAQKTLKAKQVCNAITQRKDLRWRATRIQIANK
jgi:hypothetical protein